MTDRLTEQTLLTDRRNDIQTYWQTDFSFLPKYSSHLAPKYYYMTTNWHTQMCFLGIGMEPDFPPVSEVCKLCVLVINTRYVCNTLYLQRSTFSRINFHLEKFSLCKKFSTYVLRLNWENHFPGRKPWGRKWRTHSAVTPSFVQLLEGM